ncbi:helix-turn-helix domain-containing protein [Pseudochryseolinea flava]|uniref:AraC family transcriptional regulator n=1 Tax=Pseudochryseolinea flava TaxID=2059302 RepID=A0A364Y8H1_9BACT|nr:helix-turn-helix domain-containing protein [Pseudochryseolinea flava]RAW02150.1 AraC family transcriptional regulator [Pseudochryseolinea flava]
MGNKVLFFISCLGAFNGIVLGIYFLFFPRTKKLSNYFLGALFISLSLRIGKSVLYYFDTSLLLIYLQVGLSACWFIGPSLFFYIKAEVKRVKNVPRSWIWTISLIALSILAVGLVFPYQQRPDVWNQYLVKIIYAQWGIFLVMSVVTLKNTIRDAIISKQWNLSEKWPMVALLVNVIIFTCYLTALLGHSGAVYISSAVIFSVVVYAGGFILLRKRQGDDVASSKSAKYANKKIKAEDAQFMLLRLERVMEEKAVFKNANLKLHDLAVEINVPAHQLSQLLNDTVGKSFTTYVNEYRIREACKLLATNDNITIEAIGDDVGFNSKSTFFSAFKKQMGTTPAMYVRQKTNLTV